MGAILGEAPGSNSARLIKTIPFIVITAAALLNCLTTLIFNSTEAFGNTSFPVTYQMLELIAGTLYIFLIALITYHAGVLDLGGARQQHR